MRLQTKFILVSFLLVTISLTVVGTLSYQFASNGLEGMIRERLEGVSQITQAQISELNSILPEDSSDEMWIHTVEEVIANVKIGEGGFGLIFNNEGQVLLGPESYLEGDFRRQASTMREASQGFVEYTFNETEFFTYYVPVERRNWRLAITANREEVMLPVLSIKWLIIVSVLVFAVLAIILSYAIVHSINRLLVQLVIKLTELAHQLASASGQLAQSSEGLSGDMASQAGSLEETSNAIREITEQAKETVRSVTSTDEAISEVTEMIRQSTDNSQTASTFSQDAKDVAEEGVKAMGEIVTAMQGIRGNSNEISLIVELINEITQQTKMLATNAAIEAARAGEQGKGFAVVADEVSKLAENSKDAAKQITVLIHESAVKAKAGHELAEKGGETLNQILTKSVQVSDLVKEIFSFLRSQTGKVEQVKQSMENIKEFTGRQQDSMEQISMALNGLDQITQSNSAGAEETSSTANQMSAQVLTLQEVVDGIDSLVSAKNNASAKAAKVSTEQQNLSLTYDGTVREF